MRGLQLLAIHNHNELCGPNCLKVGWQQTRLHKQSTLLHTIDSPAGKNPIKHISLHSVRRLGGQVWLA